MTMQTTEFQLRYAALAHALQSGVAASMQLDITALDKGEISATQASHTPKMLRTGVNMALVEQSAVAKLLIAKGVISEAEYFQALIDGLAEEVARYEAELSKRLGRSVTLG